MIESDPDDLTLRTIALQLIRIANQCDGLAAEMYLIDHMSERPSEEWRSRLWIPQIAAMPEGVRWPPSLFEEFAKILKARFWQEVRSGQDGAHIQVNGSLAAYVGPLRLTPVWTEVRTSKGVVIIPRDAIVKSTMRWQAEVHLYAIRLRVGPLLEALRRDGGRVALAVDQLQKQGLLPAPRQSAHRHWMEEALARHPPRKGETKEHWSTRATPDRVRTARNWLSAHDDVWRAYGGWRDANPIGNHKIP